jgi:hypothetical protein
MAAAAPNPIAILEEYLNNTISIASENIRTVLNIQGLLTIDNFVSLTENDVYQFKSQVVLLTTPILM